MAALAATAGAARYPGGDPAKARDRSHGAERTIQSGSDHGEPRHRRALHRRPRTVRTGAPGIPCDGGRVGHRPHRAPIRTLKSRELTTPYSSARTFQPSLPNARSGEVARPSFDVVRLMD